MPVSSCLQPLRKAAVGRRVSKRFLVSHADDDDDDDNTERYYDGTVTAFHATERWYTIVYDEDDDVEDVTWTELKGILVSQEEDREEEEEVSDDTATTTTTNAATMRPARTRDQAVVTPNNNNNNPKKRQASSSATPTRSGALFTTTAVTPEANDDRTKKRRVEDSMRRTSPRKPRLAKKVSQYSEQDSDDDDEDPMEEDFVNGSESDSEDDSVDDRVDDSVDDKALLPTPKRSQRAAKQKSPPNDNVGSKKYNDDGGSDDESFNIDPPTRKQAPKKPPPKRNPKANINNNNNKKMKKKPHPSSSATRVMPNTAAYPIQSLAARGAPQGALAVGRGGFRIRLLDAVRPLLSKARVQRARHLLGQGRHHAAARCVGMDDEVHAVRDVLERAGRALGMTRGGAAAAAAAASTSGDNATTSTLSLQATARLQEGLRSIEAALPGRIRVVQAGWDESTGESLCPLACVDQEFDSADALHQRTGVPLATYAMNVAADQAFGPWSVLIQRLETAGLIPLLDDQDNVNEDDEGNHHQKQPLLVCISWDGGESLPKAVWRGFARDFTCDDSCLQWALIEGASRNDPPVVVGVSPNLLVSSRTDAAITTEADNVDHKTMKASAVLLPPLSPYTSRVKLPASLLEKSIRRTFCSPKPLLEACSALLQGVPVTRHSDDDDDQKPCGYASAPPGGGTLAMLSTTWKCMLDDASPFAAPLDGSLMGLEELFMLSLVGKADPTWTLPPELLGKTVATALRTQRQPPDFSNIENTFGEDEGILVLSEEDSSSQLRNAFTVMRAAEGSKLVQRTHLQQTDPISESESCLISGFLQGLVPPVKDQRQALLDTECRLATYDVDISSTSLLLVQAVLPEPPTSWKKHSLPSLAKHVRALVTHANARMPGFRRLTRLSAWGNSDIAPVVETTQTLQWRTKEPDSAREIVTSTGKLSERESEVIDCFEAVQRWRVKQEKELVEAPQRSASDAFAAGNGKYLRMEVGTPPTEHDGRIAFLLAFAMAEEIEVVPKRGEPEIVNVLFCGDGREPLLVQRIGKARACHESESSDTSTLGYVDRGASEKDRLLVEAAEEAVSKRWEKGRIVALPLPPPGFQWKLPTASEGEEEDAEQNAEIRASLAQDRSWKFTIAGIVVNAFDARSVIRPCSLDVEHHTAVPLDSRHANLLSTALYAKTDSTDAPEAVLKSLARLHSMAAEARSCGANEGIVYDWLAVALRSQMRSAIWRDAILAIKTREKADVVLGPVESDGTCKRDMTEGCLVRVFYALESLYPTALVKTGSVSWFVRQRGAGYHHMMACLEELSREAFGSSYLEVPQTAVSDSTKPTTKDNSKTRRRAAISASLSVADSSTSITDDSDNALVPEVNTILWPHQAASVDKVVMGVKDGKRGHADASAVGSGKTLTALATVVRLANYMHEIGRKRNGSLIILPTKALLKEWLLQIAAHTSGFHVIEQRETGQLFSLTYSKSDPPIDGAALVISTLDRVRAHPFVRQSAWDFVVIDECLAIQNADAKRCPAAWRQIEVSALGVLMLSATFFRSKFHDLFYMIRMFRSPLPRSMEWLPATIHEHIVCQVPETDRTWNMESKAVPLHPKDFNHYRGIIEAYKRKQINSGKNPDFRRLFGDLTGFLRSTYEGRGRDGSFHQTSVMAEACYDACRQLLERGRRPLVFADTSDEADHFRSLLQRKGITARTWAEVSTERVAGGCGKVDNGVIVAVKSVEGQGINMQGHADSIVCRPTPSDHLEQMKGRVDRPGQTATELILIVLVAQHTIEEAKFANIHLAGNFFREYIAPVASRYKEQIDLEATLAVGKTGKLKPNTVMNAWRRSLENAGQSGAFAALDVAGSNHSESELVGDDTSVDSQSPEDRNDAQPTTTRLKAPEKVSVSTSNDTDAQMYAPRNRVLRNKGDPEAVRQAKAAAKTGAASAAVCQWLFHKKKSARRSGSLPKESLMRYSNAKPPVILDQVTIRMAVTQLSKDPKLAALIQRVGADSLIRNIGEPRHPTQASLFDRCLRAITFTMVSVLAGNSFMRKLSIKIGVCIEFLKPLARKRALKNALDEMQETPDRFDHLTPQSLLECLLRGDMKDLIFTPSLLRPLVDACHEVPGKPGYPHLWGGKAVKCGQKDDPAVYRERAREYAQGKTDVPVSASYSQPKAGFIVSLLENFEQGNISAQKMAKASDREAARMLLQLKGIGDWSAMGVLMFDMKRANIMSYGDLTLRNLLNDIYDINHNDNSHTRIESQADFPDTAENRNLIDALAIKNGWEPYRSVIVHLMYHLQEENLVLV